MQKTASVNSLVDITYVRGFVNGSPGVSVVDGNGIYHGFILDLSPYKVVFPDGTFENIYEETMDGKAKELIKRGHLSGNNVAFAPESTGLMI